MNQTAAAAPQHGFPSRDGMFRRLTIHADSVRADLVLPASEPMESLLPTIVDIVSGDRGRQAGPVAIRYQLSFPGDIPLDPSKTLDQIGIRDGGSLILTSSSTELTGPRFDDAAEAVSESLADTARRWTRRSSRLVAMAAGSWLAVVGAAILLRGARSGFRAEGVVVASITGLGSLLAATVAYRACRPAFTGLALGLIACGFAATAGALAVPGDWGAPNALFAAAASVSSAAIMRAVGRHTVVFTALAGCAAICAAAAFAVVIATVPVHAVGAAAAATSLILIEVSMPMSIAVTGLSPRMPSRPTAHSDGPMPDSDRLKDRALRARTQLRGLITGFSASATLGAIGATCDSRLPGIAFAALTGGVLLARARVHGDRVISLPLVVFGVAALSAALVAAATAYPSQSAHIAAMSMGLAAVALRMGCTARTTRLSPIGQRGVELLEYLALAAVLPLACWICGLYDVVRGLNVS